MYIDDRGRKILQGVQEIQDFKRRMIRLRENRRLQGKTTFQNLPISIENRKGSVRKGTDADGDEWRTKYKIPYGYIPGTEGADGESLDVFVGGNENAAFAYVVHIMKPPEFKEYDEDKVMLGFKSADAAKRCFMQHYDDPKFFGSMDPIPMWKFSERAFIKKHTTKKLVASMRESEGAWLQQPVEMFEDQVDTLGRGTDQDMKKSILGKNIMSNPEVRESQEHGVQGQKWGVHNPRDAGAAKTNVQKTMQQNLQNDPHTMNMMQVISRTQPQLNMIAQSQKDKAAKQQPTQPSTPQQQNQQLHDNHSEALSQLKELGWKILGAGARLSGTEGILNAVHSMVQSPAGHKMTMSSSSSGDHKLSQPKSQRRTRTSRTFESRMGTFLRESKIYYARPMRHYGTDAEESNVDLIKEAFPGDSVSFPKTKRHAELGMGYFHKKIDAAKRLVLKPAKGRRLTAGVFSEAKHALKRKIPVYAIHKGSLRRVKNVEALGSPNKYGHFGRIIFRKRKSKSK